MDIAWFKDLTNEDVSLAGGKGASLCEMYREGFPVPRGFIVTSDTYKKFLQLTGIQVEINSILKDLDIENTQKLQDVGKLIQDLIIKQGVPDEIKNEIKEAYGNMNINQELHSEISQEALKILQTGRDSPYVAVRSSATAEDLPTASFAGQQATYVNVKGAENVIKATLHCWASMYTARAIYYRVKNNFPHEKVFIAVVIQKMVNSDMAGVVFTINPATNNRSELVIEAGFGLGDAVVAGQITPDNYVVDKDSLDIKSIKVNKQDWMYFRNDYENRTEKRLLTEEKGLKQKLSDEQIKKLAKICLEIEDHYKIPMDVEFAFEGTKLFIVQARPVTTLENKVEEKEIEHGELLIEGLGASPGVGSGNVKIINSVEELNKIDEGDVLVAKMTSPDYVASMQKAVAIVTDEGGVSSHAAIVSREMGIPCIVGCENATKVLKENQLITVDSTHGKVFAGKLEIEVPKVEVLEDVKKEIVETVTGTKIYMNLGEPELIERYKDLPFDGIGLMRLEFVISSFGEHPNLMIRQGKEDEYIREISQAIEKVAKVIYPKPVIVRFSDFKSNEYKNLDGGEEFEHHEENPMIGWRGVSRYISDEFKGAFKLECRALKKVRENYKNVHSMLPFVRNKREVESCLDLMKEEGLNLSHDYKILIMAEVPSVALIPEQFASLGISGCSIGSNDLTQLCLGVDRDSARLGKMGYFDEKDPAVWKAIENIIFGFKKHGKTVSICGQAPSTYPEMAEFLVKKGITSISVNPDVVSKTREIVASVERKILLDRSSEDI